MTTHAFLAPSLTPLYIHCAAAPMMNQRYPQGETDATREGTAAHWVALEAPDTVKVGDVAPNGEIVTQEMLDGRALLRSVLLKGAHIEKRVGDPESDTWGTPDAWLYDGGTRVLWSYKFGHAPVYAFENWQEVAYLWLMSEVFRFKIIVVQPRCYSKPPIDIWEGDLAELTPLWSRLEAAQDAARAPNPVATPGPHCLRRHCAGRHTCKALQESAYHSASIPMDNAVNELTPEALGRELTVLTEAQDLLQARIDGMKAYAEVLAGKGTQVAGWQMGRTRGATKWAVPVEDVIKWGDALGVNLRKPQDVVTPKQAKLPPDVMKALSKEIPGSPVLERVNLIDAQRRLK